MIHWLSTAIRVYVLHPLTGPGYQWWSGAGSDISEILLLGGLATLVRRHNCHVRGCWRIGHHPVEGTPYHTCAKHHPTVPTKVTVEHVERLHHEAQRDAIKVREGA